MSNFEQYRSVGIGLETLFSRLDALQDNNSNYPPYNIVRIDEDTQVLELALAGFTRDEIEVSTERNVLTITARSEQNDREYIHKGLANVPSGGTGNSQMTPEWVKLSSKMVF